jgi:hypothetical protein
VGKNSDGTYIQGAIPGIGGPFETATQYFYAWAEKSKFGMDHERLKMACGSLADEIVPSVNGFKPGFLNVAARLSVNDTGPFPLCHGDFGHNNVVVNDQYKVLGVIDWESAFAAPWEVFADFPLTLSTTPAKMDAPWNYDENGVPKDEYSREQLRDQEIYVEAVKKAEAEQGMLNGPLISKSLRDSRRQNLIAAMRIYSNGKPGWYGKLVDDFLDCELREKESV